MARFSEDVHPVSDLRRKAHELVGQARRSNRPLLITQRGRGAAVLVSIEEWERREDRRELLEAILRGERDLADGHSVDEGEALERVRPAGRKWTTRR